MIASEMVGGSGTVLCPCVDADNKPIHVAISISPMSMESESILHSELKAMVSRERSEFRDIQLKEISQAVPLTQAHRIFLESIVSHIMNPISLYDVNVKRHELEGVRAELFHRARATNPDLTREKVASAVNLANCGDVRKSMDEIINPNRSGQTDTKS